MKIVAIDTEFSNDRSYVPMLSLIQINDGEDVKIFDAVTDNLQDSEIGVLLQDEKILKVFHAIRLDIEAIYNYFKFIPVNCIDTQILARKLNFGDQVSYVSLVKKYFDVDIDKKFQYSNWMKRPLGQEQIKYAKLDVEHLLDIFQLMHDRLDMHLFHEAKKETDAMLSAKLYEFDEERFWKKKINTRHTKHRMYERLREVAIWRERIAFKLNKPRDHIFPWHEVISQLDEHKITLSARFKEHERHLNKILFQD